MPAVPLTTTDRAYLLDANGDHVTADQTAPNQPLVTPNASLTSNARHVIARSTGVTVVARSSGKEVFARGDTGSLVTPKTALIVR